MYDRPPERLTTQDSGWAELFTEQVLCAVCGFEYVHVASEVVVIPGTDDYTPGPNRGGQVIIGFTCENGHRFRWVLGSHKGNLFLGAEEL